MNTFISVGSSRFERGDKVFIDGKVHLGTGKKSNTLELTLADPGFILANTLPAPYKGNRTPLNVHVGVGLKPKHIFSGYVSRLSPTGLPGKLVILGVGKSAMFKRKERSRNLTNTSPSQFARRLAKENELELDLSRANLKDLGRTGSYMQHSETDWDVLYRMCDAIGHSVYVELDTLVIHDDGVAPDERASVILRLGENVRNGFSFDLDERTRKTTSRITDYRGGLYDGEVDGLPQQRDTALNRQGLAFLNADVPSYTEKSLAYAKRHQRRKTKVFSARIDSTSLELSGKPRAIAGVQGFGSRLSGAYWIDQMTHYLGRDQYTSFELYNEGAK